mgnify:FL=1
MLYGSLLGVKIMRYLFILGLFISTNLWAQCFNFQGQQVGEFYNYNINDVAIATNNNMGMPIILYNPNVLQSMPGPTRTFFRYHECAHHALGHTVSGPSMQNEQNADCWAIRTMYQHGLLNPHVLSTIQNSIAQFGKADWTHLPGPRRAINLKACLN